MQFMQFMLGLMVGSFLNVLADRLPKGETVLWGRSHCDYCKKTLRWYELLPIVSFLLQRGRCLRCKKTLSIQYPLIELITAVGFIIFPPSSYLIFCSLLVIFVADLKYQIIPDSMVILGTIGIVGRIRENFVSGIGAACIFWILWRVTLGRGMGFGDVKLVFVLGLLLGYPLIIVALYIAFLTGAAVGVILILTGKKKLKSRIAFGPFLLWGTVCALVWGQSILHWWERFV